MRIAPAVAAILFLLGPGLPAGATADPGAPVPSPASSKPSAASLTVDVRSAAGGSLANAEILLRPATLARPAAAPVPPPEPAARRSGTEGHASFDDLAPGRYSIAVRIPGFVPGCRQDVLVPPGARQTVSIELAPSVAVEGLVLDPAGKPVDRAEACLITDVPGTDGSKGDSAGEPGNCALDFPASPKQTPDKASPLSPVGSAAVKTVEPGDAVVSSKARPGCAVTGSKGTVHLPAVAVGAYRLRVAAAGFAPLMRSMRLSVPLAAQTWRLSPAGSISGRVVDPEGRPLVGVLVTAKDQRRREDSDPAPQGRTTEAGIFRINGLPAGAFRVEAEPDDFEGITREGTIVKPGENTPIGDLRTRPGYSIEGRVVDMQGEAVRGATLRLNLPGYANRRLRRVTTDDAGRFRAGGLPGDVRMDLIVLPPDGFAPIVEHEVRAPRKDLELRVERMGSVSGVVRPGEESELPAGLRVSAQSPTPLSNAPKESASREVDPISGRFVIEKVIPAESVRIDASGGGFWSDPITVAVEGGRTAGPVELTLRRGSSMRGSVKDGTGGPVSGARVTLDSAAPVETEPSGEFAVEGVSPGEHRILATHPNYATAWLDRTFPLIEGDRIEFHLGRGGTIRGTVRDSDDAPVPGIDIQEDESRASVLTDETGRFEFQRVPAGYRSVRRIGGPSDSETRTVEVAEDGLATVEFRLAKALTGRLRRGGFPLGGVALSLARPADWGSGNVSANFSAQAGQTDTNGEFRLIGVPPGWAMLTVLDGMMEIAYSVEVPGGPSPRLEVDLPDRPVTGTIVAAADGRPVGTLVTASLPRPEGSPQSNSGSGIVTENSDTGERTQAYVGAQSRTTARTDAAGRFLLYLMGDADATLEVNAPGFEDARVTARPSQAEPVVIRLVQKSQLTIILKDLEGRPVRQARACVRGQHGGTCMTTDGDRFDMRIPDGPYTLWAGADRCATLVQERAAHTDPQTGRETLGLALSPGTVLNLRLGGRQPIPLKARVISLRDAEGREFSWVVDLNGRDADTGDWSWRTWGLAPGDYTVELRLGTGDILRKSVKVVPGPDIELLLP